MHLKSRYSLTAWMREDGKAKKTNKLLNPAGASEGTRKLIYYTSLSHGYILLIDIYFSFVKNVYYFSVSAFQPRFFHLGASLLLFCSMLQL